MRFRMLAAAVLALTPMLAMAKPLTVCTESSPDGFDVVQFNSLVTTNASADVIFQHARLLRRSREESHARARRAVGRERRRLTYTFHLRPNVAFQITDYFKPSRKLTADDVVFSFDRMLSDSNPWHKIAGASGFPHAQSMGLIKLIKFGIESRRQHGQVRTEHAERDLRADPHNGIRIDLFG